MRGDALSQSVSRTAAVAPIAVYSVVRGLRTELTGFININCQRPASQTTFAARPPLSLDADLIVARVARSCPGWHLISVNIIWLKSGGQINRAWLESLSLRQQGQRYGYRGRNLSSMAARRISLSRL